MAHSEKEWIEAKQKCRVNDSEIRMTKELGLNPRDMRSEKAKKGGVNHVGEDLSCNHRQSL